MLGKNPQKIWGASDKATPEYNLQSESYQNSTSVSTAKLQIGELLLFGNKERKEFWKLLEVLLNQYFELNYLGGTK